METKLFHLREALKRLTQLQTSQTLYGKLSHYTLASELGEGNVTTNNHLFKYDITIKLSRLPVLILENILQLCNRDVKEHRIVLSN
jgi:hypothetical protein